MTTLETIAQDAGIPPEAIVGPSRRADVVAARWEVAKAMREQGAGLAVIGAAVHRHHSTIIHALKKGVPAWSR